MKRNHLLISGVLLLTMILFLAQFSYDNWTSTQIGIPETDEFDFDPRNQEYAQRDTTLASSSLSSLNGGETALYGTATNDSIRGIVGYADYMVVSHALYDHGEPIKDNVRYLATHGIKVILDTSWWDVWPFDGVVNRYSELHFEDLAWGMNGTESVKYRIRTCIDTIGPEYIWGVTIDEEVGAPEIENFPWPLIAWYQNLFCDWMHSEYPAIKVFAWPAPPYPEFVSNSMYRINADGVVYDNYDQNITLMGEIASFLKSAYPDGPVIFFVSAAETIGGWFTCHPPTYLKRVIPEVLKHVDAVGFWTMTENLLWGWEDEQDAGYQLALRMCNQIHLNDWHTIYGNTEWFECGFGNDTVTDNLSNWNTTYWYEVPPDPSTDISLSLDKQVGSYSINLTCVNPGIHSYWWQFGPGHYRSYPDWAGTGPYGAYNLSEVSRITFWVKGNGWASHPEATVRIYLEKSNYPAPTGEIGNLTLPDITPYLTDGQWHQVSISLPLDPSAYCEWDGYASQIRFEVDYDHSVSGDTASILLDGWLVDSFDTGKALGFSDQSDYIAVDNGTLEIGGNAYFEIPIPETDSWYYQYSGIGQIQMCMNGTWTAPPDEGMLCYWNLTGIRLSNGSFDWIKINAIPPLVEILTPNEGDLISGMCSVQVNATDESGINRVEFSVDGMLQYTDLSQPFSWDWDTTADEDGLHRLNVTAYATSGAVNFYHVQVHVDNTIPTVEITSPINQTIVCDTVAVGADTDDASGIQQVRFFVDGILVSSQGSAPFGFDWDTTSHSDGSRILTCVVTDKAGNENSAMHIITVDNTGPLLSIHSLSIWGDTGLMAVNTSDSSGIDRVEFYLEGTLQYTDYSYPYQWLWSGLALPDGIYTFSVLSFDTLNQSNSASSGVEVDNTLPTLSVSWTPFGTKLQGIVEFIATASDTNGVAYVEFYIDGVIQYSDYSAPYTWICNTVLVTDGTHSFTFVASDNRGNSKGIAIDLDVDNTGPYIFVNSPANQTIFSGPSAVTVRVTVQDTTEIDTVLLSYYTGTSWTTLVMIPSGSYFESTTPVLSYDTLLLFRVFANDTLGNSFWSQTYTCDIVDHTPPSVDLEFTPSAVLVAGIVQIDVTATDSSGISMVILYVDGVPTAWLSSSPYSWEWNTSEWADGTHTLTAYVNDTRNNAKIAETMVATDNAGPQVVINSPTNLSTFEGPCAITVIATALDSAGIDSVLMSYYAGLSWIEVFMVPFGDKFEGTISGLSPGAVVQVRVFANDTLDNGAWSVTFTYHVVDTTSPSLAVTLTPETAVYSDVVHIGVTVTDVSETSMVVLYLDASQIATLNEAPFEYLLDTGLFPDGSHTLRIWANDTWGNSHHLETSIQTDNSGPVAVINSPVNLATLEGPIAISVLGTVQDEHGVDTVILGYFVEGVWTNITMTQSGMQYEGLLPILQPSVSVQLLICANDTLGNWDISSTSMIYIVDTTSPSISVLLSPNWSLLAGSVEVLASVTDVSVISTVMIYIDSSQISTLSMAPYHYMLDTSSIEDGFHTLRVWANDTWGNSNYVELSIQTDNSAPVISVTAPINGTVYDAPARMNVEASVGDSHALSHVLISYTTSGPWVTEPMVLYGSKYIWNSSLLSSGAIIRFVIFANDTLGNERTSQLYECSVMDSSGPIIAEFSLEPKAPTSFDPVTVSVSVSDHSGIDNSVLSYCVDLGPWINITMTFNAVFWANIPAMPTWSVISYRVYANDTLGHWASSPIYEYTVVPFDVLPPDVVDSSWTPTSPDDSQTVTVNVSATDPSGVITMILAYHDGSSWHNLTMTLLGGQYVAYVPSQIYRTTVTLKVYACDGQDNWGVTPLGSYTVASSDLDGPDVLLLTWSPSNPTEEDNVEVYTELFDTNGIHSVILCYGQGTIFANVSMSFNGTGYIAIIGAHPIGAQVSLCVYSCDTRDNWAIGDWTMYLVRASDVTPPVISDVEWSPSEPISNEPIIVHATVSDENTISLVLLSYFDGAVWRNLTMVWMSSDPNLYEVQMPAIDTAGTIQIWILAQDSKGNWGFTEYMDIEVQVPSPTTTLPPTTTPPPTTPIPDPVAMGVMGAIVIGLPAGLVLGLALPRFLRRNRSGK